MIQCVLMGTEGKCKCRVPCQRVVDYQDGAREFAEWLATKRDFSKEWVEWHIDHWQKGAE